MQIEILKSKIHRATVTGASLNYEGSLSIDAGLMDQVGLFPYERILCSNLANGARFETYVIPAERGSGAIVLNGATAHLGKVGDRLTIMSFSTVDEYQAKHWQPRVIVMGEKNVIANHRGL
jgi:aspartate 1-decarboxylase